MTSRDPRPPRARFERGAVAHYRLSIAHSETACGLTEGALLGLLLSTEDAATCAACIVAVHGRPAA